MANRQVSEGRKTIYYFGMALTALGLLIFASVFVTSFMNFGNFNSFDANVRSSGIRAFLGMGMTVVGRILMRIGVRGLAGSGVVLDPEQARGDIEPWSRMAGGIIKDAVDEAGLKLGAQEESKVEDMDFDEKLRKLHKLYQEGILTEEEYQAKKAVILKSS